MGAGATKQRLKLRDASCDKHDSESATSGRSRSSFTSDRDPASKRRRRSMSDSDGGGPPRDDPWADDGVGECSCFFCATPPRFANGLAAKSRAFIDIVAIFALTSVNAHMSNCE